MTKSTRPNWLFYVLILVFLGLPMLWCFFWLVGLIASQTYYIGG